MISALFRLLAAFSLVLTMTASGHTQDLDRTNPAATAKAFLIAFASRDLEAMANLVNRTNRKMFRELAAQGESHKDYESIIGVLRRTDSQNWSYDSGEIRYKGENVIEFSIVLNVQLTFEEFAVVMLTFEGGRWAVDGVPLLGTFEGITRSPPAQD